MNSTVARAWGVFGVAVVAGLLYVWISGTFAPVPQDSRTAAAATAAVREAPPVLGPPAVVAAPAATAPSFTESALGAATVALIGKESAQKLLLPQGLVRHLVLTIDSLPRHRFPAGTWPLKAPEGGFIATADDQKSPLSEDNYPRYARYVALLEKLDAHQSAALYWQAYPLLQQSYREMGHAAESFHDRLMATFADLLATPDLTPPILVQRPSQFYEFSDSDIEERSAGQKLLLRMGPQNASLVKQKLRELRAVIATTAPSTH